MGYLADRLARLGVEEALLKAGAVSGSTVLVGPEDNAVVFDWEPTMSAGAELLIDTPDRLDGVTAIGVDEHVVRHEALLYRMEVGDLHWLAVVAAR